jgi:hypothetical protein
MAKKNGDLENPQLFSFPDACHGLANRTLRAGVRKPEQMPPSY